MDPGACAQGESLCRVNMSVVKKVFWVSMTVKSLQDYHCSKVTVMFTPSIIHYPRPGFAQNYLTC